MPPLSSLKEGNGFGDGRWSVAASPDHKRDRAEWGKVPDHLWNGSQFEALPLRRCQGLVLDRQEDCLAVGEWWPAAADNQKPGTRSNAL